SGIGKRTVRLLRIEEPAVTASPRRPNRWQIETVDDAVGFLCKKARNAFKASRRPQILIVGAQGMMTHAIEADLAARGMVPVVVALDVLLADGIPDPERFACVICAHTDIRRTTAVARAVLAERQLSRLPFEAVTLPASSYPVLRRHQTETALEKVSPLPTLPFDVFALYEASLAHFEKKCDIRDFMDLCQLMKSIADNGVPGDVAEFGSYRGHSGYLLASLMAALELDKRLYLFDTFDAFPEESLGIDRFWSGSHPVDFQEVRRKFTPFPFVEFVQGDFTTTFESAGVQRLSMAYVDCDAYRATAYLIHRLFPDVLAPGGLMVFEDYGHAQLLGNRAAVHEYFDRRPGCVQFFSQFSGSYIVVKLSATSLSGDGRIEPL
ncbi:MAG TPA: TylF/MycF/NovP-related O-methyltransferase, partial [Desulfosarcina sp.]|nr:TylF/MycF/NovP-related O-methyltransferase [Desulfosarcina sp.]